MGHNEITMDMDVKMDLKEKKVEYFQLRTWTRCTVKIEAIKYIPCFVKITLIQNTNDDENLNVVIKINVPGLSVQLASSRSKDFSYGLFWTQHRKHCCIFFALDSKVNLYRHMNWLQNSIMNLEIYRKEMLELRRASRASRIDDSAVRSLNSSIDCDQGICNNTQNIRDINDILGPLPNLPDSNVNWSRRISTTSEIYEEIGDARNLNRKMSRASVASGIYEVMTSPVIPIDESARMLEQMPPPLPPPRPRVNTQSEMSRTYTNPESISSKKRKRNIFETVFSRHKSITKSKTSKTPKDQMIESPTIDLLRSHRMSYSSPDLRKVDVEVDVTHCISELENELMGRSSATEFSLRNETSILNSTISDKEALDDERNISENILSSYNISCNDSKVNLVGSNFNVKVETKSVVTVIDCPSGYCQMAPIIRSNSASSPISAPALPEKSPFFAETLSQPQIPIDVVTKAITFRRDYGMEASLQNFENLTISKGNSRRSSRDSTDQTETKKPTDSPKPNNSFDEKYPSYYPNDVQKTPQKNHRKPDAIDFLTKPNTPERTENVYIATPRHSTNSSTKTPNDTSSNLASQSATKRVVPSSGAELLPPSLKPSMTQTISSTSPLLYHKYATVTPLKESASCKKSHDISSSLKRFSSLPRFKKIDFSPLKLKINSVLNRHNPDQM